MLMEAFLHSYGGREASLESSAKAGGRETIQEVKSGIGSAEQKGRELAGEAKAKAVELKDKVVR